MTPPSKHVPLPDAEQRLAKVWLRIRDRLDERPSRFRRTAPWVFGGLAAVAVVLGLFVGWPDGAPSGSGWERATLQTATDRLDVALHDGSELELGKETRLLLAEAAASAVEIELERGRVVCDVVPNPKRRFVVRSRDVEVRVTGTRFSVERSADGHRVAVGVERGSVEVYMEGKELRRLSAGEVWSRDDREVALQPSGHAAELPAEPSATPSSALLQPRLGDAQNPEARSPSETSTGVPPGRESGPLDGLDAKGLLEHANQARREGDAAGAARAYQRLLERFPGDGRAGLSAFELGRLRMDRLGDLPGAVSALKQAVKLAPGSGFREDAMARLVRAYDSLGQKDACQRARQQYLASYPSGVHVAQLQTACD